VEQRPCQIDHFTGFLRITPAEIDELEARDDVMCNTFRYGGRSRDRWYPCQTIPEDGESISEAIWEQLQVPEG
jgi:hypothetical protein